MFTTFMAPSVSAKLGGNKVSLRDKIYGVGFVPDEPVRLTAIAGHKITSAKVVNKASVDRLGNPYTRPVVVLNLEGTSGYGVRSYWSNAPMGARVAEHDLDLNKLVEFSASQDGVPHCDSNGEPIFYATDEQPKARVEAE